MKQALSDECIQLVNRGNCFGFIRYVLAIDVIVAHFFTVLSPDITGSLSLWPRNYLKKFSMNCCTVHYFFIPLYVIVRKRQKLIVCILDLLKLKMVRWLIFKSR